MQKLKTGSLLQDPLPGGKNDFEVCGGKCWFICRRLAELHSSKENTVTFFFLHPVRNASDLNCCYAASNRTVLGWEMKQDGRVSSK